MEIHNVKQGSPAWLNLRKNYLTASDAAAMLNLSTYKTREQLLREKKTGETEDITNYQQGLFDRGHEAEELARPFAEEIVGEDLYPVVCSKEHTNLMASFDGLTMTNDIGYEHKLLNKSLKESLGNGEIPEQYKPQLEQQLMVSGAKKILFMASDGTKENMLFEWYYSDPDLRQRIIYGWEQFQKDLEAYQPEEIIMKPEAKVIEKLPTLLITIKGEVKNTNLHEYKSKVENFIININTDLSTDQDFADAESTVKFCRSAESELEMVKTMVLNQAADINDVMNTIDELKEEMRQKRLTLEKLVKAEKENIKNKIVNEGMKQIEEHADELTKGLNGMKLDGVSYDLYGVIKGKKTIESLKNAVSSEVARWKIEADKAAIGIKENLLIIKDLASDYKFLFADWRDIVVKDKDDLTLLIKARIEEHKKIEAENLEAKRLAEEQAKKSVVEEKALEPESPEPKSITDVSKLELSEYQKGYIDALNDYSILKDGVQYVGRCDVTLNEAINDFLGGV